MNFTEQITTYIIRPTRQKYHINRLGPKQQLVRTLDQAPFMVLREDLWVVNARNQKIVYSFYNNFATRYPEVCVVYLHANNGSRVEGLHYLEALLQKGFHVCLFDFSGSGLSQGEFITLGPNETEDLVSIFEELKQKKGIISMVLWGRSMGACTALMYAHRYPGNVTAMVLDSPFKDLRKLVKQIASERTGLPKIFFDPIMNIVDNDLFKKIGHRFEEYKIKQYINQNANSNVTDRKLTQQVIPSLFLASEMDKLVKCHHVEKLYSRYPGTPGITKKLHYIKNQHHENRDEKVIDKCINFIISVLEGKSHYVQQQPNNVQVIEEPSQRKIYNQVIDEKQIINENTKYSFKTQALIRPESSSLAIFDRFHPYFCFGEVPSKKDQVIIQNGCKKVCKKNLPEKINLSKNGNKVQVNHSQFSQSLKNQFNGNQRLSFMLNSYPDSKHGRFYHQSNHNLQMKPVMKDYRETLPSNLRATINGNYQKPHQQLIRNQNPMQWSANMTKKRNATISKESVSSERNGDLSSPIPNHPNKNKKINLSSNMEYNNQVETPKYSVPNNQYYNGNPNNNDYQLLVPFQIVPIANGNKGYQGRPTNSHYSHNSNYVRQDGINTGESTTKNIENFNLAQVRQSAQLFQSPKQNLNKNRSNVNVNVNVNSNTALSTTRNVNGSHNKISLARFGGGKDNH